MRDGVMFTAQFPPMAKQYRVVGQDEGAEPDEILPWCFHLSSAIKVLEKHSAGDVDDPPYDLVWIQARFVSEPWDETERVRPAVSADA